MFKDESLAALPYSWAVVDPWQGHGVPLVMKYCMEERSSNLGHSVIQHWQPSLLPPPCGTERITDGMFGYPMDSFFLFDKPSCTGGAMQKQQLVAWSVGSLHITGTEKHIPFLFLFINWWRSGAQVLQHTWGAHTRVRHLEKENSK